MRRTLYVVAVAAGIVLALLGDEPQWWIAVAALLAFPVAAGVFLRGSGPRGGRALAPALLAGLAGGVLAAVAIRLAFAAPGWLNETSADCGGPATGTQQLVLWASAVVFAVSALPILATLFVVWTRLAGARAPEGLRAPLSAFPIAVAASGVALIAAGFVTTC